MVQTILYVWLVLSSYVMERQFTEFRFLSGQYQKKGLQKQIQTSNTNVYLWENYLKLPSFSSHAAWQNCQKKKSSWHTFFFYHDNIAEQIILDRLETAERDSNMCHTMVSSI